MRTKTGPNGSADKHVKEIKRKTRRQFSAEEKIRIVLDGLRGESSISELCRREGIAESLYYNWSKDFMEAGKKRLAGDTTRQATSSEVTGLKREARDLKEVVAWPVDSFLQNITGLLECKRVYLNTQHQKDMVLKQASEHFNEKTISRLDEILCVHYLGVDKQDIVKTINTKPENLIVFNHRTDAYKNYSNFIVAFS